MSRDSCAGQVTLQWRRGAEREQVMLRREVNVFQGDTTVSAVHQKEHGMFKLFVSGIQHVRHSGVKRMLEG